MNLFVWLSREARTGLLPLFLNVPSGYALPTGNRDIVVLQWGTVPEDAPVRHILNPLRCVIRAKHERSWKQLLQLNGLKTGNRTDSYVREFLVPVFHLEALALFERPLPPVLLAAGKLNGKPPPIHGSTTPLDRRRKRAANDVLASCVEIPAKEQQSFFMRRAKRDAVRAIYALGLTSGLVHIGIAPGGRTMVVGIDPAPELDDRLAELYAVAINRFASNLEQDGYRAKGELLLGADPEFILRRPDGRVVSAARFMGHAGRVGCDGVVLPGHRVIKPLVELRPDPSREPGQLIRSLRRLMRQAAGMIGDGNLEWLAGSMPVRGLPLGGHVHVSGVWLNERLLRAYDNYVALPLVLIEGAAAGHRKPRYGFLGDFRIKRHGGFEYRTLPSWLESPELALGVLELVRLVTLHYRDLTRNPLASIDVQRAYYSSDKTELLPVVQQLWQELEQLSGYAAVRSVLDPLRDRLFRMESWEEEADIRLRWGLRLASSEGTLLPHS